MNVGYRFYRQMELYCIWHEPGQSPCFCSRADAVVIIVYYRCPSFLFKPLAQFGLCFYDTNTGAHFVPVTQLIPLSLPTVAYHSEVGWSVGRRSWQHRMCCSRFLQFAVGETSPGQADTLFLLTFYVEENWGAWGWRVGGQGRGGKQTGGGVRWLLHQEYGDRWQKKKKAGQQR